MNQDSRRPRHTADTAALESSGTGWGVMEPGALTLKPGTCVGSDAPRPYEATELLGRGGMGEVHLAFDERVGRDVAVKVLLEDGRSRSDLRASFLREARLQGVLDHPGIVPVHDVDRDAEGHDFIVMKRVMGTTFEKVLRSVREGDSALSEKFSQRRLLSAYLQVCLTVDYAHSRGVVHRDLKPRNLMLGDYGEVYVLDWGIAKVEGDEGLVRVLPGGAEHADSGTTATYLLGTPGYMAPEQIDDPTSVDARADVYSLGVVLFALLTLERLHRGESAVEILESTRRGVDARPSARAPGKGLPPEYDTICARATAVDPAERYPNVRELHDAVARVIDDDRDTRLRVELAARHLADAEQALSPIGLPGLSRSAARRIALRHAARSLALHPEGKEAAALVRTLMLTPPDETSQEVEQETRGLDGAEEVRINWYGAMVGLILLGVTAALLTWAGVRSWSAVALLLGPLAVAIVVAMSAKHAPQGVHWPSLATAVCIAFSVAGMSRVAGSLWFPFTYAVLYTAITTWNHGLGRWRIVCIAIVFTGMLAPSLLEFAGIATPQFVFHDDRVTLLPDMIALQPVRTYLVFGLGQTAAIVLIVAAFIRLSRAEVETLRRFQLMAWHLKGLAPHVAEHRDTSATSESTAHDPALTPEGRALRQDTAKTMAD